MNKSVPSIIDRKESSAIKGLLIFLIVLGHCGLLMQNPITEGKRILYHYFYSFHVYCFFLLPFLYGYIQKSTKGWSNICNDVKKNFVKLYIPYLWICAICYAIFRLVAHGSVSILYTLQAIFTGECSSLNDGVGFGFPWFLPTMFIVLLIYSIWHNTDSKWIKGIIVLISSLCWVCIFVKGISFFTQICQSVPLALLQGFRCFLLGLISYTVIDRLERCCRQKTTALYFLYAIIFVALSILYFMSRMGMITIKSSIFLFVMPISAFCCLFGIKGILAKSKLLVLLGEHSFGIYLFHVIILNIFSTILSHWGIGPDILWGIIVFVASLAISLGITLLLDKMPKLKNMLFPVYKPKASSAK